MKKGFSISLTLLFILTGMHLSVASHFCMGGLASKRVNFTGKTAGCGMETHCGHGNHHGNSFDSHCCADVVKVYAVDNVFTSSAACKTVKAVHTLPYEVPGLPTQGRLVFLAGIPVLYPPGPPPITGVSLSSIRVFRI